MATFVVQADQQEQGNINVLNANLAGPAAATAGSTVQSPILNGSSTVSIQVTGVFVATLIVEASLDGANWVQLGGVPLVNCSSGVNQQTITTTGIFQADVAGFAYIRVTCSAYTSGTAVVTIRESAGNGMFALDAPIPTGANIIGGVYPRVLAGAGANVSRIKSAATTNATSVKASQANLYGGWVSNTSAAVKFMKFYNKASAPTVGTDTPVATLLIPAGTTVQVSAAVAGSNFAAGLAYAITGLVADADTTVTAVDDVHGCLMYA